MKAFVTGGTGFIGGHVVRKLLARGDTVTALARNPESGAARSLAAAGATLAHGDVTDRESMRAGMEGAEVVFHIAGWFQVGVRDTGPGHATNVDGTRNTLGLAVELGVPHIVYVSTCGVFGNTHGQIIEPVVPERDGGWLSEYDRTKYLAHRVADEFVEKGAPVSICCPGFVYGPDDPSPTGNFIRLMLRRRLLALPVKRSGGCFAHVEDVADGIIAAGDRGRPGGLYILGGDRMGFDQLVAMVGQISGIRMPITFGPALVPLMIAFMKGVAAILPVPEHYHPETLASFDAVTWWVSHEATTRELGYRPRPCTEGLRETVLHEMEKLGLEGE